MYNLERVRRSPEVPQKVTCGQLHGSDCEVELLPHDRYCPRCGRIAQSVAWHVPPEVIAEQGASQVRIALVCRTAGGPVRSTVEIGIVGRLGVEPLPLDLTAETTYAKLPLPSAKEKTDFTLYCHHKAARPGSWGEWESIDTEKTITLVARVPTLCPFPRVVILRHESDSQKIQVSTPVPVPHQLDGKDITPHVDNVSIAISKVTRSKSTPASMEVVVGPTAKESGRIGTVSFSCGTAKCQVPVFMIPRDASLDIPNLVYGIDFGTHGTSIAVRDTVSGNTTFLGPSRRFSSHITMPDVERPETWRFGSDVSDDDAFVYRNLKTDVRSSQEVSPDPRVVLDWYLRKLLKNWIEPDLKSKIKNPKSGNVLFVFTLPVLDNGDEFRRQHDAMLQAIQSAGYPFLGQVQTLLEPEAALFAALREVNNMEPDSPVVILDSGGGTTDVTVAKLRYEDGQCRLGDVSSASLQFHQSHAEGLLPWPDIGGNTVTMLLLPSAVRRLQKSAMKGAPDESKIVVILLKALTGKDYPWSPGLFDSQAPFRRDSSSWLRDVSGVFSALENKKLQFCNVMESTNQGEVGVTSSDVVAAAAMVARRISEKCEQFVQPQIGNSRADLVFVGGNCEIDVLRDVLREMNFVDEYHVPKGGNLRLMVVEGATKVIDFDFPPLGYGVRVEVATENWSDEVLRIEAESPLLPRARTSKPFQKGNVSVMFEIRNTDGTVEVYPGFEESWSFESAGACIASVEGNLLVLESRGGAGDEVRRRAVEIR